MSRVCAAGQMDGARYELDMYVGNEQSEKAKLVQLETGLETARQQDADNKRWVGRELAPPPGPTLVGWWLVVRFHA